MLRFTNLDELVAALGEVTKWRRVAEAVRRADRVPPEVTCSIGDSLTYRVTTRPDCTELTGHRRYLEARCVLDGAAVIEVAPEADLQPTDTYSDLADRRHFAGSGERYRLDAGEIAVVEVGEAVRDVAVDGHLMVLRITVEG
jgi:evolved beta-galactosidase subunit beta